MTTTLADVRQDLGRVEGKLDTFIKQMETQDDRTGKLTERLGKVENRQHWYAGAGSILGMILGALGFHGVHQ